MSEEVHTPPVIDLDAILQPVSDDAPSGESLRYSGLYGDIVEARRQDDTLNRGDWQTEIKYADYQKVVDLAVPALTSSSKDLQVAVWLSEALIRIHGFAGLRDSLKMVAGLQENFWETLFPIIDEGDMEGRANAIAWLDTQGASAIRSAPYTSRGFGYNDWVDAKTFDIPSNIESLDYDTQQKYASLKTQAETEGRTTSEMWKASVGQTNRAAIEATNAVVAECWAAYADLNRVIDEKFERNQMPGLGELKKALEDIHAQIKKLVETKRLEEPSETDDSASSDQSAEEVGASAPTGGGAGGGPVNDRPEALKRLGEIAAFFQRTEPHSPVSYLVQRAVKWGHMPLDSWLREVIKDPSVLEQLNETLGIGAAQFAADTPADASTPSASDW